MPYNELSQQVFEEKFHFAYAQEISFCSYYTGNWLVIPNFAFLPPSPYLFFTLIPKHKFWKVVCVIMYLTSDCVGMRKEHNLK